MATIIPRWEWRTFGDDLDEAATALARYRTGSDNESDELYFLSPGCENVKVRDGLMDIKVLREVNPDGLEQWFPLMKAAFPLAAADVTRVYEGLHVEPTQAGGASRTLAELVADLASARPPARAVKVHKLRRRCKIGKLHGRDLGRRGERPPGADPRDRGRRRGCRHRGRPGSRTGRPGQHELHQLSGRARRRQARALRHDRRRDELDQVPRRRACSGRELAHGRRPGRDDAPRRRPRGVRADRTRAARRGR